MKNKILLVFFALILVNAASGAELVYEGWIYNGRNLVFDDINYKILISTNGNTLLLKTDETTETLEYMDCYSEEYSRICYNNSVYDIDEEDYKAYLYIYYLQPDLDISRTIDQNILSIGETADFEVLIENNGDADAAEVVYSEDFPENVELVDVKYGYMKGNTAYWEGEIKEGESQEITYRIRSKGKIDDYIKASLSYFDGYEEKEIFSDSIRLYSEDVLGIELSVDKIDYELAEDINFTLALENNGIKEIEIEELRLTFPQNIIVNKGDIPEKNGGYIWDGTIDKEESESFEFELEGQKSGTYYIVADVEYTYKDSTFNEDNNKIGFVVHEEGIELTSSLSGDEQVYSGQVLNIFVKLRNKNSFSKLKDVELKTISDLGFFEGIRHNIVDVNETVLLLNTEIMMPETSSISKYPIKFNVTYKTEDNTPYSTILDRTIVVNPLKTISIVPSISSSEINEETPLTMTVSLKNEGLKDYKDVFLKSNIPDIFSVKGVTSISSNVDKEEEISALTFTITPARVQQNSVYWLNFTATYMDDDKEYKVTKDVRITVKAVKPDISVTKELDSSSSSLGEKLDVTYTITNKDASSVHDLVLITSESQNYDTLKVFSKDVLKLDPGETTSFKAEEILAKKTGSQESGSSILFFKDKHSRQFNISSGSPSASVSESEFNEPVIYLEKTANKTNPYVGETLKIKLNITNIGRGAVSGRIDGASLEIPQGTSKLIEKEVSYTEAGKYDVPKSVFYYDDQDRRAYSNKIEINVIEKPESGTGTPSHGNAPQSDTQETPLPEEKKPGIFMRFYLFLKKFFTG
ncbi:hypothetical protein JXC34_03720 [Candidatus Woesearchaeota archaeon]|nr:hypothetical protein [Candidatus Woesearchaeota archaeon]